MYIRIIPYKYLFSYLIAGYLMFKCFPIKTDNLLLYIHSMVL